MSEHNPYAPPAAAVFDAPHAVAQQADTFHPQGRHRSAGHGWGWYKSAWQLFKPHPFKWWFALIISFGLMVAAGLLPYLNLLTSQVFPILAAGFGACAAKVRQDGDFALGDVFDGFRKRPLVLMTVGALYLAILLALLGVLSLVFGAKDLLHVFTGGWAAQEASQRMFQEQGGLFYLGYFGAMMFAFFCIAFAPYLVHEQGLSAPQAMIASFKGCLKNVPAGLVAILCYILLAIGATIPLALGWLVLIPVIVLAIYAAYRDIYLASD